MSAHADDWFAGEEVGILGHGHDGLVIDRVKHSRAMVRPEPIEKVIAMAAWATVQALIDETHKLDPASREIVLMYLRRYEVPTELWVS